MATNIGPKIGIDGEAEYKRQMSDIINQQKTLNSEMKKVKSSFDESTSAQKKNKAMAEVLSKQLDLAKQKRTALQEVIDKGNKKLEEQKQKLDELKSAEGDHTKEIANAQAEYDKTASALQTYQQQLNNTEADINKLDSALKNATGPKAFAAELEEASKKMKDVGEGMTKVGDTLSKGVTAPIVGLAGASIAAFKQVDAGMDIIVTKTGASGEALTDMQNRAKDLATTIPTDFETAGSAIGEVNTRFGLTGDALEELSGQFIKFAQINGTDVSSSIDSVQKAMDAFGLQASDASGFLDTLNVVGQNTGISMDTLTSLMTTNATAFQELGLGASDAANLLGTLEKSGIDTSTVMTGLKKAQAEAAKEGTDMSTVLQQAFSSSGDAVDIFGSKAGPQLYAAMQSGVLSLDNFTASSDGLNSSMGSVSDTFTNTLDPIDQWQLTLNQLQITGAELGNSIATVAMPVLQELGTKVQEVGEWFNGLSEDQQQTIVKTLAVAAAVGPVLSVGGKLISGVGSLIEVVENLVGGIGGLTLSFNPVVAGIGLAIAAGVALYQNWDTVKGYAEDLGNAISSTWDGITSATTEAWDAVKNAISDKINAAKDTVKGAIDGISGFFKNAVLKFPDIKLPHFSIVGEFSLKPPSVPHLSVDWYAKAYSQAVAFNQPTVIPTASGLKGFGDGAGAEIVIGQDLLLNTITDAVRNAYSVPGTSNTYGGTTINVYGAPGQDVSELADIVADKINADVARKRGAFA
ncbi:phage tail tape measure protein [Anaerolactibacter massiliensis]|uniref:phage tail tape measure protein n=1 Tax=Anaerolactibacter massiliensis TaxID=2044573 RepID=UPI000CF95818|nr:phage tail tape measure protein [Anaerolactibacter massiliensis]